MLLAARNRFFSLFSGHLHIPADAIRFQADPGQHHFRARIVDETDPATKATNIRQEVDELVTGRSPAPAAIGLDAWDLAAIRPLRLRPPPAAALKSTAIRPAEQDDPTQPIRGGGGAGSSLIQVEYREDGNQVDLRLDQANRLRDEDVFGDGADAASGGDDADEAMDALVGSAAALVPEAYADATESPQAAAAALVGAAGDADGAVPASLSAGVTINGRAVAPDAVEDELPENPAASLPELPVDTGEDVAVIDAGGNVAANSGQIVDTQGAVGTLIVLGDSYTSDAIVQINVLVDETGIAGDAGTASLHVMGNSLDNVAEFIRELEGNPYAQGYFAGLRWNVDRVDGDYFDVKLVRQFNDLSDGDIVRQTASDHYNLVRSGANELINDVTALHGGKQYDLVIVGGDYFGANWIFQTNVLLNSDNVVLAAGEGGAGDLTVSTGANWLTNSATIVDYAADAQALTPQMRAVAEALINGTATLDPATGQLIPGDGSMTLNVLFITGDYYNLNVLEQTNVISDSDDVSQTLAGGEAGYVSSGGNAAANEALLVNMGPLGGQYVGGSQYSEAVLVQSNIIVQSADLPPGQTAAGANPSALAPEAAAFIQHSPMPAPPPQEEAIGAPPAEGAAQAGSDILSGVMA